MIENFNEKEDFGYKPLDNKPEFPGGNSNMFQWVSKNIIYPNEAKHKNWQDKVFVQFVITKDGSISKIEIVKGKYPALN